MIKIITTLLTLFAFNASYAKTVNVGIILGFTGPIETLTPGMSAGAELAFNEASDSGKLLNGAKINIIKADSTCVDSAAATSAAEGLVSQGVTAIMGADCSGVTGAVLSNVAVPNGVPMISPSATSPGLTTAVDNGLFFRTAPSDARGGEVLAQITKDRGIQSVAVTYVNTDYGVGLADVYQAAAESRGITVTAKTAHEADKADYSAEVGVLSSAGGDALVVIGYLDQGGNQIIQGSLDSGAYDTFILSDGMIGSSLTDTFGSDLDGSFGSMPGSLGAGALKFKEFAEANGVDPSVYVGESYDAAALIVLAMALGGSDSSATVKNYVMSAANGPGTKIYAGELGKALDLINSGIAIDYDGATDVYFTDVGEAFGAFLEKGIEGGAFVDVAQR